MGIMIIVDSTADMRPEVAAKVGIVPLSVQFGEKTYISGVDITAQQFYEMLAESEELFAHPLHPYTRALLSAIPQPDPIAERQKQLIVYDPACHNYSETNQPDWHEIVPGHFVLASEDELTEYKKKFFLTKGPL